jgi:hypothetical protein
MNYEQVLAQAREQDIYAAIESIAKTGEFLQVMMDLYWKAKDLPATIAVAQAGIAYCFTSSARGSDPAHVSELRGRAKAIAYNLGSCCWPGWGEPGIAITPVECAIGYEAARCNLRLAIELARPAKAMGNAHWLVGAYELANREFDSAYASFERARQALAEERAMALMAAGYAQLTRHLQSPADAPTHRAFESAMTDLQNEGSNDANDFAEQSATVKSSLEKWYAQQK